VQDGHPSQLDIDEATSGFIHITTRLFASYPFRYFVGLLDTFGLLLIASPLLCGW